MELLSKSVLTIQSLIVTGLIFTAIIMELMPEETAKVFVIPVLAAAFCMGVIQMWFYNNKR